MTHGDDCDAPDWEGPATAETLLEDLDVLLNEYHMLDIIGDSQYRAIMTVARVALTGKCNESN
jgi:hypothetical protein